MLPFYTVYVSILYCGTCFTSNAHPMFTQIMSMDYLQYNFSSKEETELQHPLWKASPLPSTIVFSKCLSEICQLLKGHLIGKPSVFNWTIFSEPFVTGQRYWGTPCQTTWRQNLVWKRKSKGFDVEMCHIDNTNANQNVWRCSDGNLSGSLANSVGPQLYFFLFLF